MGIDKEIRQNGFRSIQNKTMVNILYTNGWMMERIKNFVKAEDITPQQYNILRILRGAGKPLSTLQIRERMLDKMSDTSRVVDRMVAKSLLNKTVSAEDRRKVDIEITPEGIEKLENLDSRNEELDGMLGNLSEQELQMLGSLLDKLRNNHH